MVLRSFDLQTNLLQTNLSGFVSHVKFQANKMLKEHILNKMMFFLFFAFWLLDYMDGV